SQPVLSNNVEEKSPQKPEPGNGKHSPPTVSVTVPGVQSPKQLPLSRKSPSQRVMSIILSVALVILLASGAVYYLTNQRQNNSQDNANMLSRAKTATAQVEITPTSTTIPTPSPGLFIAGKYNGTMQSQVTNQVNRLSVYIVQKQGEGAIKGSITIDSVAYTLH